MTSNKPILAITLGDPGGVGPEIIAKALAHADVYDRSRPLIIGERRALEAAIRITGTPLEVRSVDDLADAGEHPGLGSVREAALATLGSALLIVALLMVGQLTITGLRTNFL